MQVGIDARRRIDLRSPASAELSSQSGSRWPSRLIAVRRRSSGGRRGSPSRCERSNPDRGGDRPHAHQLLLEGGELGIVRLVTDEQEMRDLLERRVGGEIGDLVAAVDELGLVDQQILVSPTVWPARPRVSAVLAVVVTGVLRGRWTGKDPSRSGSTARSRSGKPLSTQIRRMRRPPCPADDRPPLPVARRMRGGDELEHPEPPLPGPVDRLADWPFARSARSNRPQATRSSSRSASGPVWPSVLTDAGSTSSRLGRMRSIAPTDSGCIASGSTIEACSSRRCSCSCRVRTRGRVMEGPRLAGFRRSVHPRSTRGVHRLPRLLRRDVVRGRHRGEGLHELARRSGSRDERGDRLRGHDLVLGPRLRRRRHSRSGDRRPDPTSSDVETELRSLGVVSATIVGETPLATGFVAEQVVERPPILHAIEQRLHRTRLPQHGESTALPHRQGACSADG